MSRTNPQDRSDFLAAPLCHPSATGRAAAAVLALVIGLAGVTAGSLVALPAAAQSVPAKPTLQMHKGKRLKTLPSVSGAKQVPAAIGQSSPYARAAARRADSGSPPPGHARVRPRTVPDAASHPAG